MERIQWHLPQGDNLICSRLEIADGLLTGRYDGLQGVGSEKSRRVREVCELRRFPLVYACGDTREDFDMLGLADKKYCRWQEMVWRACA